MFCFKLDNNISGIINAPKVCPPGHKFDSKGVARRVLR